VEARLRHILRHDPQGDRKVPEREDRGDDAARGDLDEPPRLGVGAGGGEGAPTNRHGWGSVAWSGGQSHVSLTCDLDVYDRVGGGDGFAAGFFYGLLSGEPPEKALRLGGAHGGLGGRSPRDKTMATLEQVKALAKGGSARIQR